MVLGEIKSGKSLFRKLNEYSKELQVKQGEIIKKHNLLLKQYDELEHLKNNMNEYLGKDKTEKKELVNEYVKRQQIENKDLHKAEVKKLKNIER